MRQPGNEETGWNLTVACGDGLGMGHKNLDAFSDGLGCFGMVWDEILELIQKKHTSLGHVKTI